jgi:hypothetical protein
MYEGEIAQLKDVARIFKVGQQKALDMRMKARRFFLKEENADVTIAQVRIANGLDARLNSLTIPEKQDLIERICREVFLNHRTNTKGGLGHLNPDSPEIKKTIERVCGEHNFNEYLIYRIMKGI